MRTRGSLSLIVTLRLLTATHAQDTVHVQAPAWLIGGLEFTSAQAVDGWTSVPNMDDPANAVSGTAVLMSDGTAADSLACGTLVNGLALFGNVAVVYRGSCAFDAKALTAQNFGASALVIINNTPGAPTSMGPGANGATITIPVILITDVAGAALRNEIDSGNVVLYIGPECGVTGAACHDLRTFLGSTAHVVGREVRYGITVRNQGSIQAESVTVTFDHPAIYTFGSASEVPTVITPGHVEWHFDSILPLSQKIITARLDLPQEPAYVGSTFTSFASVSTADPDQDPTNDQSSLIHTIQGSYDPNDMVVHTSSGQSDDVYFLAQDEWMEYTIRFQNTGTAFALSVYITDTLSPLIDPSGVELLGASHACGFFFPAPNVLQFEFPGMVLPDSVSNEPESHGFVSFRVPPVSSLLVGDSIQNAADIHFDFNPPVRTNTTTLVCEGSVGVAAPRALVEVSAYPNPADEYALIPLPTNIQKGAVVVVDATGRHVAIPTPTFDGTRLRLNTGALPNGTYQVITGQPVPVVRLVVMH